MESAHAVSSNLRWAFQLRSFPEARCQDGVSRPVDHRLKRNRRRRNPDRHSCLAAEWKQVSLSGQPEAERRFRRKLYHRCSTRRLNAGSRSGANHGTDRSSLSSTKDPAENRAQSCTSTNQPLSADQSRAPESGEGLLTSNLVGFRDAVVQFAEPLGGDLQFGCGVVF